MKTNLIILIALLMGCNDAIKDASHQKSEHKVKAGFQNPIVVQEIFTDSLRIFEQKFIYERSPIFLGKFTFSDTINIDKVKKNDGILEYKTAKNIKIDPDYIDLFIDPSKEIFSKNQDSLRIYQSDNLGNLYFPVYLVNQTNQPKVISFEKGYFSGLQEALDSNGIWHAIENPSQPDCINPVWQINLQQEEYLAFLFPKYKGNYKTKLRVRFQIGNQIFISEIYDGEINYSQMYIHPNSRLWLSLVDSTKTTSIIKQCFFGSLPAGFNENGIEKNISSQYSYLQNTTK